MDPTPTDRELEALKVLWLQGEATVRDIHREIDAGGGTLAYTTVLSLLQVMEQKGLVGHRQRGKAYFYFAKADRDRTFQSLAGGFLDKVFDGAVDEYLVHAMQSRRISAEELDRLEAMIARAKTQSKKDERNPAMNLPLDECVRALSGWILDFYLLSTILLALCFVGFRLFRQPVHRLTVAWIVMIELALLAVAIAMPGWPRISLANAAARETPAPSEVFVADPVPVPIDLDVQSGRESPVGWAKRSDGPPSETSDIPVARRTIW